MWIINRQSWFIFGTQNSLGILNNLLLESTAPKLAEFSDDVGFPGLELGEDVLHRSSLHPALYIQRDQSHITLPANR